jgi:DNA-binding transcriptional MerR regulator
VYDIDGLTVSDLAREAGVSPHTFRFYEQVGLLPVPTRSDSGDRLYDPPLVDRLRFIRGAKRVGLQLDDIAELLDHGQHPCGETDRLLRQRLAEIDAEVTELLGGRDELIRLLDAHPPAATDDDTERAGGAETSSQEGGDIGGSLSSVWLSLRPTPVPALRLRRRLTNARV